MFYLHTASLKSRCFLFILIILVFILDSSLVRQSFFSIWMQMYLKEIQCINKVTLPYLTFHSRESGYRKTETNKQKQKQNGKSPSGSCASLCHADFLFLLACRAKFIISINITRSVIRSVIRSDPWSGPWSDPVRSRFCRSRFEDKCLMLLTTSRQLG